MPHAAVVRFAASRALGSAGLGPVGSRIGGRLVGMAVENHISHRDLAGARRAVESVAPGISRPFQTGAGPL